MIMLLVSVPAGYWFTRVSWRRAGLSAAGVSIGIVAGAIVAKSHGLPYVETAPSILGIAVAYGASILNELDRQAHRIYAEHMNAVHQRLLTKAAVEASFDGIIVADQGGAIQTLNPAGGHARRRGGGVRRAAHSGRRALAAAGGPGRGGGRPTRCASAPARRSTLPDRDRAASRSRWRSAPARR